MMKLALVSILVLPVLLSAAAYGVEVSFPDPGLRAAVRAAINKPEGPILDTDLAGLNRLEAAGSNISGLSGIEYCTDLTILNLQDNQLTDLTPVAGLTKLYGFSFNDNQVSDITPLANLVNMENLQFRNNNVSSIGALSGMTKLYLLFMYGNPVTDLSPIAGLTSLTQLWLGYEVSDLAPLSGLTNLITLSVEGKVSDLTPLASLTNLVYLYLDNNQISNLAPLASLCSVRWLNLSHNDIANLEPLSGLTGLETVFLEHNSISDVSALSALANLNELYMAYNQISDLSPLSVLSALTSLSVAVNMVVDLEPLRTLTGLDELYLDYNDIVDLTPLVENSGLDVGDDVWVENNPLDEQTDCWAVNELMSRGVLVHWDGECSFDECTTIMSKISPALARWAMHFDELPSTIDSWDGGIPDMYEVALPVAALCNGDNVLAAVFTSNRTKILTAPSYQFYLEDGWWFYGIPYEDFFAALATMDPACAAGLATFGFEDLQTYEPVTPSGDFDSDTATNQQEYLNVMAWGGSDHDYARAAMSPLTTGDTPMPTASIATLMCLAVSIFATGTALLRKRM